MDTVDRTRDSNPLKPSILMVGPFPPPLGGAAKISQAVFEALEAEHVTVERIVTSASTLSHQRSVRYHMQRSRGTIRGLATLLVRARHTKTVYIVPDAGLGVWYTLAYGLVAAIAYRRVFFHHHSCRYIEQETAAMRLITRLTRSKATHILLTDEMARKFQKRYGPVHARVVGNAQFTAIPANDLERAPGRLRLGHLSNLCAAKGFFRVVEAFERFRSAGIDTELHLAGPVLELAVQAEIDTLRTTYGSAVVDHGPLQGQAKAAFYASLDLFLFPTNFDQEAAPNVVYEAAAGGAPTLSVARACIPEMVGTLGGAVCDRGDDFGAFALQWFILEGANLSVLHRRSVKDRFVLENARAAQQFADLVVDMASPNRSARSPSP